MTVNAEIEYFPFGGGQIRVFDAGRKLGDPYRICVTFKWLDAGQTVAEATGVYGRSPSPAELKAMLVAARVVGKRIVFTRRSGARPGAREFFSQEQVEP